MEDQDFKKGVKLKLSTLDDQTELLSQAIQETKEDLEENEVKVKDVVDRVEMLQKRMNNFREEWEDYKDAMDQELQDQQQGKMATQTMLEERLDTVVNNQKSLRNALQIMIANQSMLVDQLHDKHGQELETEKVKDKNQDLLQKLTGGQSE